MIGDGGVPLGRTLFAWAKLPRPGRDNKKSRVLKYSGSGGGKQPKSEPLSPEAAKAATSSSEMILVPSL